MKKTRIIALLLTAVLSIGLCGCGQSAMKEGDSAQGGAEEGTVENSGVKIMKAASITSARNDSHEYVCETMFCNLINEYTNGTIQAEYYPASQLGSTSELAEAVGLGTVQSTMGVCQDVYANIEPISLISCMPYLFSNYEHFKAFLENGNPVITEINRRLADNADILVLGYIYRPARATITQGTAIYGPDDFKGMVIRSPESAVNVRWLEAMGASPVTITWSELFTSLSQGAAQGAENTITTMADSSLQDIVDYCSETNHMMMVNLITVNRTWFDSLDDAEQEALRKAADEVTAYSWEVFGDATEAAWKAFEEAGVTCIRFDEIDFDAFQEKSADVYKAFIEEGFFTQEQYDQILNLDYESNG